jgi:hypothetical protein
MFVRRGFSVAVHVRPEVLIIDEVIAVGDAEFQRRCFEHLHMLKRQGVTIVLVSHGLGLLQSMCDRIAWLDHGHLVEEGRPIDVIGRYIGSVDAQDAERFGQESQEATEGHGSRQGSHEIEVQAVEMLDARGEPLTMPVTGEPLTFRIHYVAHSPVEDPIFGILIEHDTGASLAALNTQLDGVTTGTIFGKGYIDYGVPRFTLMPGRIFLSIGCTDTDGLKVYDYLHQWYEIHVRAAEGAGSDRAGLIELVGRWEQPVREARQELTG